MSIAAIIPARFASSRFPGKALALIAGTPMIVRVCEQVRKCSLVDHIVVATDDERIAAICRQADIDVKMTATHHLTGTDRMIEAIRGMDAEIYVNVQGDEPLIAPSSVGTVIELYRRSVSVGVDVATVYLEGATPEQEASTAVVHLVPTRNERILTLSRLPVPCGFQATYQRNIHVGLYAYSRVALERFASRSPGPVELSESIELMRFLEHGEAVACAPVVEPSIGVDYPDDIGRAEAMLQGVNSAAESLSQRLANVRLLTLDVDGVLTDGGLYYTEAGDVMRRFQVQDGMGIKRLIASGVEVAFVSQSATAAIQARAQALGISRCLTGVSDKLVAVSGLCRELGVGLKNVAHMGDDVNDLPLLRAVGLPATVPHAVPDVAAAAQWRSTAAGGAGAVRELCERIIAARGGAPVPKGRP